jgi:dihydrolipoamide dehydrogenase
METSETELLVIGAGPGGYVVALRAAQLGTEVVLVDEDAYGGTCLNYGCIPSKALISVTETAHGPGHDTYRGVYSDPYVDWEEFQGWRDGVVERLTGGVESLCSRSGVELVGGRATFIDGSEVQIEGEADGPDRIAFQDCIVATGSRPIELPAFPFDDDRVLSSRMALDLDALPTELVVVGAGYIGMELSMAFAQLGAQVTVLEALDSVMPTYEADLVQPVRRRARELGIDIRLGHRVEGCESTDDGVRVRASTDGEDVLVEGNHVLVAVGRTPVTDTLSLDATEAAVGDDGFIVTDEAGRTAADGIWAIGDVAGEPMLAHAASAEGKQVAASIAGEDPGEHGPIPAAVFTEPEIATVGLTAEEAASRGHEVVQGRCQFGANGRALTRGGPDGFVRIVADEEDETLLGSQIVGPEASELVAVPSVVLSMDGTLSDLEGAVYTHPTLAEAVLEAAENARGRAIHTNW